MWQCLSYGDELSFHTPEAFHKTWGKTASKGCNSIAYFGNYLELRKQSEAIAQEYTHIFRQDKNADGAPTVFNILCDLLILKESRSGSFTPLGCKDHYLPHFTWPQREAITSCQWIILNLKVLILYGFFFSPPPQTLNIIHLPMKVLLLFNGLKINSFIIGTIRYTIQYLSQEMVLLLNQYPKITW